MEVHLLKEEGNQLAEEGKFELAIEKYSKAMTIGEFLKSKQFIIYIHNTLKARPMTTGY